MSGLLCPVLRLSVLDPCHVLPLGRPQRASSNYRGAERPAGIGGGLYYRENTKSASSIYIGARATSHTHARLLDHHVSIPTENTKSADPNFPPCPYTPQESPYAPYSPYVFPLPYVFPMLHTSTCVSPVHTNASLDISIGAINPMGRRPCGAAFPGFGKGLAPLQGAGERSLACGQWFRQP